MPRPPSRGAVTDSFGWRTWTSPPRMHYGEDTIGDGNYAPVTGTVIFAGYYGGLGNLVVIQQVGTNVLWLVGHHASIAVRVGQNVVEGQTFLGQIGTTGDSTGIHAHTERRVGGSASNVQGGTATNPRLYYTATAGGDTSPIPKKRRNSDMTDLCYYVPTADPKYPDIKAKSIWYQKNTGAPVVKMTDDFATSIEYAAWCALNGAMTRVETTAAKINDLIVLRGLGPAKESTSVLDIDQEALGKTIAADLAALVSFPTPDVIAVAVNDEAAERLKS